MQNKKIIFALFLMGLSSFTLASTHHFSSSKPSLIKKSAGEEQIVGTLTHVSCSGNQCVTTGIIETPNGPGYSPLSMLSKDSGKAWSAPVIPKTPNDQRGAFSDISCEGDHCASIGYYADETNPHAIFYTSDNGGQSWSKPTIATTSDNQGVELRGISCTHNLCLAVGYIGPWYDSGQAYQPAVYVSNDQGNTWSAPITTKISGSKAMFTSVSCQDKSETNCTAAGYEFNEQDNQIPFTAKISKLSSAWVITTNTSLKLPDDTNTGMLNDIACSGDQGANCIAVGYYLEHDGRHKPLVYQTNNGGSSWSAPITPLAPTFVGGGLMAASCTGTHCVASGLYYDWILNYGQPLAYTSEDNGLTWSNPIEPPFNPNYNENIGGSILGLSCTGSLGQNCVGVGEYDDGEQGLAYPMTYTSQDGGTSWSQAHIFNQKSFSAKK